MRLRLLLISAALLLCPALAGAALVLHVDHVELAPSDVDRTVPLDVYLVDPDGADEWLNRYGVMLVGSANTPVGVRFVPPSALPSAVHPYVFRDYPGYEPGDLQADHSSMLVVQGPQNPNIRANISEAYNGLFSVSVLVPAGTLPGEYPILVDPNFTDFGTASPPLMWTLGPPGGVTIVPEPAGLLPLAAAPLALRRRRRSHRR